MSQKREREERGEDKNEKKLKEDPESVVLRALRENDLSRARKILYERIEELFDVRIDPKKADDLPILIFASSFGLADVTKVLIQGGTDSNAFDSTKMTALHYASKYGHVDVAKVLIQNGADVK